MLQTGHVIGFHIGGYDFAHVVTNIAYDAATVATVWVSPPLRRALTTADDMLFRPKLMGTAQNPDSFSASYEFGKWVQPGGVRFIEALV